MIGANGLLLSTEIPTPGDTEINVGLVLVIIGAAAVPLTDIPAPADIAGYPDDAVFVIIGDNGLALFIEIPVPALNDINVGLVLVIIGAAAVPPTVIPAPPVIAGYPEEAVLVIIGAAGVPVIDIPAPADNAG